MRARAGAGRRVPTPLGCCCSTLHHLPAAQSPLVFAHNDLLSGNIMVATDGTSTPTMTFIDFEYADWAPRGYDLANHFCE